MKRVRVAGAALNQTPLDWDNNARNILQAIGAARDDGVSVVCLPELCISGYGCEDAFHSTGIEREVFAVLEECVAATSGMIVSFGLPLLYKSVLFDTACLAVDGRIVGFVPKRHLAGEGLYYEPRWFKAWPKGVRDEVRIGARTYPIGDLVFDVGGLNIGFEICEDAWVAKRPGGDLAAQGVDLILNPSASHFGFGRHEIRKRFVVEGSRAFGVSYVYANLMGNEAGRIIYDGGALIASAGRMLATGPRFKFDPVHLTQAVIDVEVTRLHRARAGSFTPDLAGRNPLLLSCNFSYPDIDPETPDAEPPAWERSEHLKEEEFTRAIMLGLFDYLRKSRSKGFVVSVSGGADSSAVACLAALSFEAAHNDLGHERFCAALSHIPELRQTNSHRERIARMLHCVYQASQNSSERTRQAATTLIEALGGTIACLEIDKLVEHYVAGAEQVLGRKLTWETDDVALQNIQARVRGPSVWLLANVKNALLLATSNRSEAAVGYATMDGDTCGSLSPIAGIDKAFLRRWLRWLEQIGPEGLHPVPALSAVTRLAPTAELRPQQRHQTDEDDLMPYDVLDVIERAAIRDKQAPVEVFRQIHQQFPQYAVDELVVWIERFFRLWCRNQWKRERYAPSFHVDDENLDPKTWCRFPIISGGFDRELTALRQYVDEHFR